LKRQGGKNVKKKGSSFDQHFLVDNLEKKEGEIPDRISHCNGSWKETTLTRHVEKRQEGDRREQALHGM